MISDYYLIVNTDKTSNYLVVQRSATHLSVRIRDRVVVGEGDNPLPGAPDRRPSLAGGVLGRVVRKRPLGGDPDRDLLAASTSEGQERQA